MGPTSRHSSRSPSRTLSSSLSLSGWVALLTLLWGCQDPSTQPEPRLEPWLKENETARTQKQPTLHRYELTEGQSLSVVLPVRGAEPRGTLSGIAGHVEVNLNDLTTSRGHFRFPLSRLELHATGAPSNGSKGPPDEVLGENIGPSDFSTEAQRWLGLGEKVAKETRDAHEFAVFEFTHARGLSHTKARHAALKKTGGKGETREVVGTAEGSLSLRGLSVQRQIPITIRFHYQEGVQKNEPSTIEVILRKPVTVPFEEYEIRARDSGGRAISEPRLFSGYGVASSANITGQLSLKKRPVP